jgi:RimJ/RimL family protein N-acetyltransferase
MENIAKGNFSLRLLPPSQWEDYRSIRLEALKTNPELFGSNYYDEETYSESDWRSLLENGSRAIFALYHEESLIGLSGVKLKNDDNTTAVLFASFIKTPYRGKGLSRLFYQARIGWAREKQCKSIIVSHRVGNTLSKAANKRFGFKFSNTEEVNWGNGVRADGLVYVLELNEP